MTIDSFVSVEELLPSRGALLGARLFSHTSFAIGAGVMLVIFAVALLAPWLEPPDLWLAHLALDRRHRSGHVGRYWNHARGSRWLFRRPRRSRGELHHHHAAGAAGDPGGARSGGVHRQLHADRDRRARPAAVGSLRGGDAQRH